MLIVDTGPIVAAADSADPGHQPCAHLLLHATGPLRTTSLVVAEAAYLIGRRISAEAEASFFRSIARGAILIDPLTNDDLGRIAELVDTYSDLPLGGTDASVIVLAERLNQNTIATLDRRHFSVVRPTHERCDICRRSMTSWSFVTATTRSCAAADAPRPRSARPKRLHSRTVHASTSRRSANQCATGCLWKLTCRELSTLRPPSQTGCFASGEMILNGWDSQPETNTHSH